jgi:hypothetical protein
VKKIDKGLFNLDISLHKRIITTNVLKMFLNGGHPSPHPSMDTFSSTLNSTRNTCLERRGGEGEEE